MERTFVMIKPDGVGRGLAGDFISRYEKRGLKLVALKMQHLTAAQAERHYCEHKGKSFYNELVAFITSGPSIQIVLEGKDAVAQVRKMHGATNCLDALPGTIRGDFGLSNQKNLVHASDSPETAAREIALYFEEDEIISYELPIAEWLR